MTRNTRWLTLPLLLTTLTTATAMADSLVLDQDVAPSVVRTPARVAALDSTSAADTANTPPPAERERTTIFGLPKNIGPGDRVIRTVVGAGLAGLGIYGLATDEIGTTASAVMLGVSAVPLATAATGYCPLYQLIGVDYTF